MLRWFSLFADPGVEDDPEREGECEEGDLQEAGEGVDDANDRNPDAPVCENDGDANFAEVGEGEKSPSAIEAVAVVFPIVKPAGEGRGDEGAIDELIDRDFDCDDGEGGFGAENVGLKSVKGIDENAHGGPKRDGKEDIVEVFTLDAEFLKNRDAQRFGDEAAGDDGGGGGEAVAEFFFERGELIEPGGGGRVMVIADEKDQHESLDEEGGKKIGSCRLETGLPWGWFFGGKRAGGHGADYWIGSPLAREGCAFN